MMSNINLADVKVSYEGQELPAINLISKLQMQLQEAATRIAAIASTLSDLQAALLNYNTVEVKLTLSKEDFSRFRSLGGNDDSDRILKAVMTLIHPEGTEHSDNPVELRMATPPSECRPVMTKAQEPVLSLVSDQQTVDQIQSAQPIAAETAIRKNTTKCPRCSP